MNPDLLSLLPDEPKPVDFLSLFLHNELIDILVHETNRYAMQHLASAQLDPQPHVDNDNRAGNETVSCNDNADGRHAQANDRYVLDQVVTLYHAGLGNLLRRNRYCLILKFPHFSNNDDMPDKNNANYD